MVANLGGAMLWPDCDISTIWTFPIDVVNITGPEFRCPTFVTAARKLKLTLVLFSCSTVLANTRSNFQSRMCRPTSPNAPVIVKQLYDKARI